jgi:protein-S-isoprenylcysteine O-methyltransferase Ste14
MAGRIAAFVYGLVAYAAFFVVILYLIGFVGNMVVPKSIDSGREGPLEQALLWNIGLIVLFGVQHSVMARPAFKARWTRLVPAPIERSTFVLATSVVFALLYWQWRPITAEVWHVENPVAAAALTGLSFAGWGVLFYSSFLVDHFDLFGLRQVYFHLIGKQYTQPELKTVSLYKWVRHPLMLGVLIAVWAAPTMTYGHLVFSTVMTAYVFVGIALEERDLKRLLGSEYERYRRETPMLVPLPWRRGAGRTAVGSRQSSAR